MPKKDTKAAHVRRCYEAWKKANIHVREAEKERLRFYMGDQWREAEVTKRKAQNRPMLVVNRCRPAVNQIEGDIRLNPPGPQCLPVGGGADGDTADIFEGLIREVEYRSNAQTAYSTAGVYAAASGYGVLELATEYVSDRSNAQQLVINPIEDPATVFFDPAARLANRQDAGWAGKIKAYSRESYIAQFGSKRAVLQPRAAQMTGGWIQDALGIEGGYAQINEWTGEGKGPFYVVEFYEVESEEETLRLYSDDIARWDTDPRPPGVKPKPGEEKGRKIQRRKIVKYVVDALETLDETDWMGTIIPLIPVLGPEIYIDGKLHRLSLISDALDSQRGLNFAATTAAVISGNLTQAPWIGPAGSFDDPRWETSNSENWAYLEYTPKFVTDENGQNQLAPAPQRNTYETSIQWVIALGQWFSDNIKATTSIFDPSLGQNKGDQSGKAIEQLRSESSVGNFSYADNLHRAIGILYQQICCILPKILDGPRVVTIVRPDSQHEVVTINQEFSEGKQGKANNICIGQYSVRVTAGPDFQTRQKESLAVMMDFLKVSPAVAANPGVASSILRMLGDGNPQVEQIADLISPRPDSSQSPQQTQQQMMQLQQENQQLKQLAMQMREAIQAKLPELDAKKFIAMLDSITKIHVAEINASKDLDRAGGDRQANLLETQLGMAHDAGMQAAEHEHAQGLQASQQQAASEQAQQGHQNAMEQQQAQAEQQPTGVQ